MDIVLKGSTPAATTAGILLLTRARQLGLPVTVRVVGEPDTRERVVGPALLYAPVLAGCGVGREDGQGALVIVPGAATAPVMMTASPHGVDGWFFVDRSGNGHHPATQAFVRLSRDPRVEARRLGKEVRRAMELLGLAPDPAVLDVLFGAQAPPLTRLSLGLRAGRSMAGGRGEPITRFVTGSAVERDPLPPLASPEETQAGLESGAYRWILDGLSPALRDRAEEWLDTALALAREDGGRDLPLTHAILELASNLVQLPPYSVLPPLGAAEDAVAVGLRTAMQTTEEADAMAQLVQMFRFLGGRYIAADEHALDVGAAPAPEDHIARWEWFCVEVRRGRKRATELWDQISDPVQ